MYEGLSMDNPLIRNAHYEKHRSELYEDPRYKFKHLTLANSSIIAAGFIPPQEDLALAQHYYLAYIAEGI